MSRNSGLVFIIPGAIWVFAFTILPVLYMVYLSFTDGHLVRSESEFVGLENYARIVDRDLFEVLGRSLYFAVGSTILTLVAGILTAWVFSYDSPFIRGLRRLFTIPLFAAPIAVATIGSIILNPRFGLFGRELFFLADRDTALLALMFIDAWIWTPLVFIVVINAIHNTPRLIYDSARLDTSSNTSIFRYITLPVVQRSLILVALLRLVDGFSTFDLPYTLTGGGPARSTETLALRIFNDGFRRFELGLGAAYGVILLVICLVIAFIFITLLKRQPATRKVFRAIRQSVPVTALERYFAEQSSLRTDNRREKSVIESYFKGGRR